MPQYTKNPPLLEAAITAEPMPQFQIWLAEAKNAGLVEPTAMALATVDADHKPSVRMVLLKGLHEGGLCFYTHYDSRKARALAANPFAAATFWWDKLERSVRFEGSIEKLPTAFSEAYFHSRPRGSQLGAHTSYQSRVLASRESLEQRLAATTAQFEGQEVPLPDNWGGYWLRPTRIEFWQGRDNRLHDRLRFDCIDGRWQLERLEP
jgi:pyridoxamine 5'-phosphate oxidase